MHVAYDLPLDKNEATLHTFLIFLFALVHAVTPQVKEKTHAFSLSFFLFCLVGYVPLVR